MTGEEARQMAGTGWWKDKTDEEIVLFQLWEERLCMDWKDFHQAVSKCLGREVWTHEFAGVERLRQEFLTKILNDFGGK